MMQINSDASAGKIDADLSFVIALFIFIAAIGKSGQFPLFPWLMRAMEGPTTVSALIHGATMVNSGIYIVARLFDFYIAAEALVVVAAIGVLSAFIGATSALVQDEIKKVLAYSTMSHLSLAFIGLGAGSLAIGMTHLTNHAIFMGMGILSLSGIPPFSGFYSKDAVLIATLTNPQTPGLISTLTIIAGALSIAYGARIWVLLFANKPRDTELYAKTTTPSFFWITLPLGIMAFVTLGLGFFQEELVHFFSPNTTQEAHIAWFAPALLSLIALLGALVYFFYYKRVDLLQKVSAQPLMKTIRGVLFNGYYIEQMITWLVKNIIVGSFAKAINWIDRYIVDAAVNAMEGVMHRGFTLFGKTHSLVVSNQAGLMLVGACSILIVILVRSLV